MKNALIACFLLLSTLTFTGCPVGLDYPPDEPGSKKIDRDLLGDWVCEGSVDDCEVVKFTITESEKGSYKVSVREKGSMYALETDNLEAWITEIEGLIIFYAKPDNEDKYYLYAIQKVDKNAFYGSDISLKEGGVDAVTSIESLREQIKASMKYEDFMSSRKRYARE